MANVLEQTMSLNDKVSDSYEKMNSSLKRQQIVYSEVTKTMLGFTKTANGFGLCFGRIRTGYESYRIRNRVDKQKNGFCVSGYAKKVKRLSRRPILLMTTVPIIRLNH